MIVEMFEKFDIKFIIYIVVCIIIVAYGSYQVLQLYQGLGALLYFVGSLYVCIVYGIRWFGSDGDGAIPWPPMINTCPDYLTYYSRTVNGVKVDTCIDTVGIADQSVPGALTKFPSDGSTPPESAFFPLATTTANKNTELCNRAIQYKLTWEGITNGESCIGTNGQPGSSGGAAGTTCVQLPARA